MKPFAVLLAFTCVFVGNVTAQNPDLTDGERRSKPADNEVSDDERGVLEDLLEGGAITQEKFEKLVGRAESDSVIEKGDAATPLSENDGQDSVTQGGFGFFVSEVELGEIDATFANEALPDWRDSWTDVERKRAGVQFMLGNGSVGGVVRAFTEEISSSYFSSHSPFPLDLDAYGLGVFGWSHTSIGEMSGDSSTFLDLRGGVDIVFGSGVASSLFYPSGGDWTVNYYDIHARAGIGIGNVEDGDPSISGGLNLSMLRGDLENGSGYWSTESIQFRAINYGFYVGAQLGEQVRFDLLFGGIEGLAFSVGTSF